MYVLQAAMETPDEYADLPGMTRVLQKGVIYETYLGVRAKRKLNP